MNPGALRRVQPSRRFLLRVLRRLLDGERGGWIGHRPSRLLPWLCVDCGKKVGSSHPRTVVYSPETTRAYGAVIDASMTGGADAVLAALRHLAMMVHCDFTGELRLPHTHASPQSAGTEESCRVP